jgi:hypothetical protein
VIFRVMLCCRFRVVLGMNCMAMRHVSVVGRRLVIASLMMLRGFEVMLRCFLVVLRRLLVMLCTLMIRHHRLLICLKIASKTPWPSDQASSHVSF